MAEGEIPRESFQAGTLTVLQREGDAGLGTGRVTDADHGLRFLTMRAFLAEAYLADPPSPLAPLLAPQSDFASRDICVTSLRSKGRKHLEFDDFSLKARIEVLPPARWL